ncbi:MAG: glycerate kinase [Muribaculaceae bacterium]|nr:glycerate kinase [Muribaculaceae bacterium]
MKILVCPDSFKGSLSAKEVADTISTALLEKFPNVMILQIPLADGGEGTTDIVKTSLFPNEIKVSAHDPLGKLINVGFHIDITGKKAFIESARVIGLPLLTTEERNPLKTSSKGLGEVIQHAIKRGCNEITVSLGGTATSDGGMGMLEVLSQIDTHKIRFKAICDVNNPLLGNNGAVEVFARQKGATESDLPILEKRLEYFIGVLKKKGLCSDKNTTRPGAGAAGGLGFAFQTILKAKTFSGIDYVLEITDFINKTKGVDLIITGEGKIDSQSLMGKVLSGVLRIACNENIPVVAVSGLVENKDVLLTSGIKEVFPISDPKLSQEENMKPENTKKNIKKAIETMLQSNIFQQNKN